jgi:hypothetical protein
MLNYASAATSSMPAAAQAATQQRVKFDHMPTVTPVPLLTAATHVFKGMQP